MDECEAAVVITEKIPARMHPPSSSINRYLEDLRGALETDNDRAPWLPLKMLGKVTVAP